MLFSARTDPAVILIGLNEKNGNARASRTVLTSYSFFGGAGAAPRNIASHDGGDHLLLLDLRVNVLDVAYPHITHCYADCNAPLLSHCNSDSVPT